MQAPLISQPAPARSDERPPVFRELTRRYIRPQRMVLESKLNSLLFVLKIPFKSWLSARALQKHVDDDVPRKWIEDFKDRKVLIVGSGPSLDRVPADFFAGFDSSLHINFAVRKARGRDTDYFFTTDIGPVREYLDAIDDEVFRALGPERCILAPIYLDQFGMLTPAGRDLFSMLRCDAAGWRVQSITVAGIKLPILLRYHPRQPDWSRFRAPALGRTLPVLDHSSALTAILFAAAMGSKAIGLIGCDFSAGRAASANSAQDVPDAKVFSAAPAKFRKIQEALATQGIAVTNHSWLV